MKFSGLAVFVVEVTVGAAARSWMGGGGIAVVPAVVVFSTAEEGKAFLTAAGLFVGGLWRFRICVWFTGRGSWGRDAGCSGCNVGIFDAKGLQGEVPEVP